MTDATSRARIVLQQYLRDHDIECHRPSTATRMVKAITESGLALYDTRTHAAVPREPSDEVVERVARAIQQAAEQNGAAPWDMLPAIFKHAQEQRREEARAAIAALVGTQTQGGEPDAPP